jgi:uncharacterized membrane protein
MPAVAFDVVLFHALPSGMPAVAFDVLLLLALPSAAVAFDVSFGEAFFLKLLGLVHTPLFRHVYPLSFPDRSALDKSRAI